MASKGIFGGIFGGGLRLVGAGMGQNAGAVTPPVPGQTIVATPVVVALVQVGDLVLVNGQFSVTKDATAGLLQILLQQGSDAGLQTMDGFTVVRNMARWSANDAVHMSIVGAFHVNTIAGGDNVAVQLLIGTVAGNGSGTVAIGNGRVQQYVFRGGGLVVPST